MICNTYFAPATEKTFEIINMKIKLNGAGKPFAVLNNTNHDAKWLGNIYLVLVVGMIGPLTLLNCYNALIIKKLLCVIRKRLASLCILKVEELMK